MKYLKDLRGITVYPDGGRGFGQPITKVTYETAMKHIGKDFVESGFDVCSLKGGGCGD